MDKRYNFMGHSIAKKVWFVDGKSFESDKGTNNGKAKAVAYCREHLISEEDILKFDSMMEFNRYLYLAKKQEEGKIKDLHDHFIFQLIPSFTNSDGIYHEETTYEADFYYYDVEHKKYIVEDVKGNLEDTFRVKWKLFDYKYHDRNLCIQCVRSKCSKSISIYDDTKWYVFSENQRKVSVRTQRMREELEAYRQAEKEAKKVAKEKTRLKALEDKEKLTKVEKARLEELKKKYDR